MQYDLYGLTHVGKVRQRNEDQFLVARLKKTSKTLFSSLDEEESEGVSAHEESDALLLMVADGVGGSDQGQLASRTAVESLNEQLKRVAGCYFGLGIDDEHELITQLEEAVESAHQDVVRKRGEQSSGATTLTLVTLIWPTAYVLHVGDSRGYYLQADRLRQFTRDQTLAEQLIDQGVLEEGDAAVKKFEHVLTQAVGSHTATPTVSLLDLDPGDSLLLCSDGLTKHVDDETLEDVLRNGGSAKAICERLLELALDGGGRDNITVIVGHMIDDSQGT